MRFALVAALVLILPVIASAQSIGDVGSSFTLSMSPQYPAPHSQATLSLLSSSLDLNNATMSVLVGGKNIYKGDVQPISVALGAAGSITTIKVTVTTGGTNYTHTLIVQPQDVALVVEPISSSPPLYPGKSSVPLEGSVRVVAMANLKRASGKNIDPTTLSYAWTVDGVQLSNSSGIGKTAIVVDSPLQYRAGTVSVAITTQDGTLTGGDSVTLTSLDPTLRIYQNDPLLGILYDHALTDTFTISNAEATLYAAPFSLTTKSGTPSLQWFLNGTAAQTGNSITLRPTGSGQGSASLSLVASSGSNTSATTNLSLTFGATKSSNFFGL